MFKGSESMNNMAPSNPEHEIKFTQKNKACPNSSKFKHSFVFIISLSIVVLITIPTVVILSSNGDQSTSSRKVRTPNQYWNHYFLPTSVVVRHYNITLQLLNTTYDILKYNQTDMFYGFVSVHFHVNSQTDFVVIHTRNLSFFSVSLKEVTGSNPEPANVNIANTIYDDFYQHMILLLDRPLSRGAKCRLEIKYSGIMSTGIKTGIISTTYYDVSKKRKYYILYTKLQPEGARSLFPCFDDLDKKATYSMKIIHKKKYQALSNMPLDTRKNFNSSQLLFSEDHWNLEGPFMISEFEPTVIPMSTYLLAFVLCENYESVSTQMDVDKMVRVWYPNDFNNSAMIPLNYATKIETFFERYFNYSSPLPKTDHIYIPDFVIGAMENWGLITYRELRLLVSEYESEQQIRSRFMTIAHELTHFWLGNWVTTKTWGEIWLNEGFATYFASFAYYSQGTLLEQAAEELFLYERRFILKNDLKSELPVITNVTDPETFDAASSHMVYRKGQTILVWLNSIMGPSNFQKAMQTYIKRFVMGNPTNEDFFDCMDEVGISEDDSTNMPKLKIFFKPWLYKAGFPIVSIDYDLAKEEIILAQISDDRHSYVGNKWPIHTTYITGSDIYDTKIYFNDTKIFKKPLGEHGFVVLNSNGKSYLRVNYSEPLWNRIIDEMKSPNSKISQIHKIVLLDDAFYFLETNKMNISIIKGLVETFVNETNTIPWLIFYYKIFDRLHEIFKDDDLSIRFSELVIKLSSKMLGETLKLNADDHVNLVDNFNQQIILTMSCEVGNDIALNWVSQRFLGWIRRHTAIKLPKHIINVILFYGMRINDKKRHWRALWNMLIRSSHDGPITHAEIAVGLAGTTKPYLLNKLLNHYLTPNTHRSIFDKQQDFLNVVGWIMKSTNGIIVLQRWVVANSGMIMKYAFGDISREDQVVAFEGLLTKICTNVYEQHLVAPLIILHRKGQGLEATVARNNNWKENEGKNLIETL